MRTRLSRSGEGEDAPDPTTDRNLLACEAARYRSAIRNILFLRL
jgi:hypothetical protein